MVANELVGVHGQTHRASRAAPLEAGVAENFREAHGLGDSGNALRSGDDDGFEARFDPLAFDVLGDFLQVAQAAVRAGAEESDVDFGALDRVAGTQLHVRVGFFGRGAILLVQLDGRGEVFVDENGLAGIDAPCDGRGDVFGAEADGVVVGGVRVAGERFPAGDGGFELACGRRVGSATEVVERGLVGVDIADARAAFDGHVADSHALLLREAVERRTRVFIGEAEAAVHAEAADDVEDHVLGIHAGGEGAVNAHAADLRLAQRHGLRGEHVAHLARADAEGDGAESAVGGRVGIAAGDGRAGLGDALLGADDVDDALLAAGDVEKLDAVVGAVFAEFLDHRVGEGVGKRLLALVRGDDVIHRGERALREEHLEPKVAEHAESLRAGDLVDEVRADEQLGHAVGQLAHGVSFPDFVEQGFSHKGGIVRI